jgi:hypothetical protein
MIPYNEEVINDLFDMFDESIKKTNILDFR